MNRILTFCLSRELFLSILSLQHLACSERSAKQEQAETIPGRDAIETKGSLDELLARASVTFNALKPHLVQSCAVAECHAASEEINMRSFPFAIAGSFVSDHIRAAYGEQASTGQVQEIVVTEMLSAMKSGYMPPAPLPKVDPKLIAVVEKWLQGGLLP